ncbi:MAG: hypothetical protein A2580_18225 [Hydrogenophilales bacterium RIFOXYD1_FULL_62_11]|nr:MAG: hypothetical protein A2580_18225 [Hydrogenophilales bacterium RIFOXYD1_FULL_62_11]
MQINIGPFRGTQFTPEQMFTPDPLASGYDQRQVVMLPALTQAFLETYDPKEGWAVEVSTEVLNIDMHPLDRDGVQPSSAVPCALFKASLTDPQGRTVATASTVWTISGPTEWEKGESNARTRLYEACGLQGRFGNPPPDTGVSKTGQVVQLRSDTSAKSYTPHVEEDKGDTGDVDERALIEQAAEAAQQSQDTDEGKVEPEASTQDPSTDEAAPASAEAAEEPSPAAPAADAAQEQSGTSSSPRGKRVRVADDAPAPKGLIDQVKRLAAMRGKKLEKEDMTKGEANALLKKMSSPEED